MYSVTENYHKAMNAAVHKWYVTGKATLKDGTVIDLTEDDILQGSLCIKNQCCSDEKVDIGQVYMGEMDMTVVRQSIKGADWLGASIDLKFHRYEPDGEFVYVHPDISGPESYGRIHASHEKEGFEAWKAFSSRLTGREWWDAGSSSASITWDLPCLTRILNISMTGLPGSYRQAMKDADGEILADSDGEILMAARSSGLDVAKTVNVYTDSSKSTLIGSAVFRDSGYSNISISPEGGHIDTYSLYFEFPDSYGDDVGLFICNVYQDAYSSDFWAEVPIGTWNVDSSEAAGSGVALTCYDNMLAFEQEYDEDEKSVTAFLSSSPRDFLRSMTSYVSSVSGISTLLQNSYLIPQLINGSSTILFKTVSGVRSWKTWRDVLSSAAAALGGFAAANRYGKIEIRNYGTASVDTVTPATFLSEGSTFSGSETDFRRVNAALDDSTAIKVKNSNWGTGIKSYTLDIGANPFIAVKTKAQATTLVRNISNGLQPIKFSAFSIDRAAGLVYDRGDRITITGGGADSSFSYYITKFSFDGHKYHMEGAAPVKMESSSQGGGGSSSSKSSGPYLKTNGSNMANAFSAGPSSFKVRGSICFPDVYSNVTDNDP